MSDFVDPADPAAVEAVLAKGLEALGVASLLSQLAPIPDLDVQPAQRGGIFRAPAPAAVGFGDRRLVIDDRSAVLEHWVGGVVLARDPVARAALPGTLAALVSRAVAASGAADEVSVLLTALRDAVSI